MSELPESMRRKVDFDTGSECTHNQVVMNSPRQPGDGPPRCWYCGKTNPWPKSWSLPPEPGPEVTAVRDGKGRVWKRKQSIWDPRLCDWVYTSPGGGYTRLGSWGSLLADAGTLTDASAELEEGE